MVEAEAEEFLRCEQRHSGLFGRAVAFTLVAFYAGRDEIVRRAFTALRTREDVVERQVFGVLVLAAVLTAVAVADIDPRPFHRSLAVIATQMDVMTKPHDRRHGKRGRGRVQDIVAVVFLDKDRTAKPKADRTSDAHGAERLVRKIQE